MSMACAEEQSTFTEHDPVVHTQQQALYSDVRGAGPLNGVEWQIDAPWRIEPGGGVAQGHAKVPITVTFHDVRDQGTTNRPAFPFGALCGLYILEDPTSEGAPRQVTVIDPAHFHEIEASRRWTLDGALTGGPNAHLLRRIWNGDTPDAVLNIGEWTDWNGTAFYEPREQTPGADVKLVVMARVGRGTSCSATPMSQDEILLQLTRGRESHRMSPVIPPPGGPGPVDPNAAQFFFGDFLKVHMASAPLPRFDARWVYGDLHYHSQGTDNEGESGIHYRGVNQAMKAMGLDYLFATEHASNSRKITGVHQFFVTDIPGVPWFLQSAKEWLINFLRDNSIGFPVIEFDSLRDMSPQRFAYLHDWLNLPQGANAEVSASGGPARAPQIFLGGEVDVWPEVSAVEARAGRFRYAYLRSYLFRNACNELPLDLIPIPIRTDFATHCAGDTSYDFGAGEYGVRDPQGIVELAAARQHIVYLPYTSSAPGAVSGRNAFISSTTTTYGGASRRLGSMLQDELETSKKGYFFLAHPVAAASGSSVDRLGPDIVPYSDAQLERAFRSRYVLGLQFWNENERFQSQAGSKKFPMLHQQGHVYQPPQVEPVPLPDRNHVIVSFDWNWQTLDDSGVAVSLGDGARMWDQVLRWGITPSRTAAVPWLAPGAPRKFFVAGGSDAHGDLNYRRLGRFLGWSGANDTAIGKPRNLTYVGSERPGGPNAVGQNQVVESLATGRFSVTDGPALRIAIDVNNNGVVDDQDVAMGGDFAAGPGMVALLVEWKSTPEFGPIESVDLYVGAQAGTHEGMVYAPAGHGTTGSGVCDQRRIPECPMEDGYVRDPGTSLKFTVASSQGMSGVRRVELRPSDYKLFQTACVTEPPDPELGPRTVCRAIDTQYPSRLYTRAFARTALPRAKRHYALTNPIWMTADAPPSPPTLELQHLSCASNVNTFAVALTQGMVPGQIVAEYMVNNSGAWTPLSTTTLTATGGASVSVRARTCNANACSGFATRGISGPTCIPPPPPPPRKCGRNQRCCELDGNGGCAICAPLKASCP
jgi:hypothetical protein